MTSEDTSDALSGVGTDDASVAARHRSWDEIADRLYHASIIAKGVAQGIVEQEAGRQGVESYLQEVEVRFAGLAEEVQGREVR